MDLVMALKALLLGAVEGLTEFLPISSTGHLIVVEDLVRFRPGSREAFIVSIQSGAIFAVMWEYRARLLRMLRGLLHDGADRRLAVNVAIAFLPAAVVGVLAKDFIDTVLFFPLPVAAALVAGGVIILWVEGAHARGNWRPRVASIDDMTALDALKIGIAQCFSLIPGTSRSGATIIGGLIFGFSRTAATQFSFFLAMPTIVAASAYSLYKARAQIGGADLPLFALGFVAAFAAALFCVRWLLHYIAHHDFRAFAWYRIAFGGVILATAYLGWVRWGD
ncbi:MAG: undecaprenyl-diphosphate phosphatase [Sutterellaceae bacterium]|nr:undecaprenyl-diphosphate phosphatase [Burkholderiaceae bacterium]MDW8429667.1 undecaprenyl-diphosphate phosphatase [Sutterellaceae bacterium]